MEDVGLCLQQHRAMSPHHHLGTMANLPIPQSHFRVPTNLSLHLNIWFSKVVCDNSLAPLLKHINKWESASHVDGYYAMSVTVIPYRGYKSIIIIVFKEEKTYLMSPANCICLDFAKMSSMTMVKNIDTLKSMTIGSTSIFMVYPKYCILQF